MPSMRVVITGESEGANIGGSRQLRPRDPNGFAPSATPHPPVLHGFLSSLNTDESPYSFIGCEVWNARDESQQDPAIFASRIDLTISQHGQELDRVQYENFVSRLAQLLERESGDSLRVELQIASALSPAGARGLCLKLFLFACAAGQEQAQLRWSLGLARLQQALLFEARAIRRDGL